MYRIAILAVMITLGAASAAATAITSCVGGTLTYYEGLGSTGCTIGDFTFKDFALVSTIATAGTPATQIATADEIWVTPPATATGAMGFSSADFEVFYPNRVRYLLHYLIDPPPPILPGFDLYLDAESPTGGGIATVSVTACAGGTYDIYGDVCEPDAPEVGPYKGEVYYKSFASGPPDKLLVASIPFVDPVSTIDVWLRIDLDARVPGSSSEITGTRVGIADEASTVPEPGSFALLGAGLLGLALRLRRKS